MSYNCDYCGEMIPERALITLRFNYSDFIKFNEVSEFRENYHYHKECAKHILRETGKKIIPETKTESHNTITE